MTTRKLLFYLILMMSSWIVPAANAGDAVFTQQREGILTSAPDEPAAAEITRADGSQPVLTPRKMRHREGTGEEPAAGDRTDKRSRYKPCKEGEGDRR